MLQFFQSCWSSFCKHIVVDINICKIAQANRLYGSQLKLITMKQCILILMRLRLICLYRRWKQLDYKSTSEYHYEHTKPYYRRLSIKSFILGQRTPIIAQSNSFGNQENSCLPVLTVRSAKKGKRALYINNLLNSAFER